MQRFRGEGVPFVPPGVVQGVEGVVVPCGEDKDVGSGGLIPGAGSGGRAVCTDPEQVDALPHGTGPGRRSGFAAQPVGAPQVTDGQWPDVAPLPQVVGLEKQCGSADVADAGSDELPPGAVFPPDAVVSEGDQIQVRRGGDDGVVRVFGPGSQIVAAGGQAADLEPFAELRPE